MKTFKTPKGTELPIMDIKGKDYLQAAPRILWMREEHPDWSIETELLNFTEKQAVFKATIRDGSGKILSQATSMETLAGFDSFLEKAETCAVSRAAAFCGYGTLMAQELEEQDRKTARAKLAEAPVDPKPQAVVPKAPLPKPVASPAPQGKATLPKPNPSLASATSEDPGAFVVSIGKKYNGVRLDAIDTIELADWHNYLNAGHTENPVVLKTIAAVEAYLIDRGYQPRG